MGAIAVVLGLAVLFNFVILRIKWNRGEYANVGVDVAMLLLLNIVFGGSILGVISATIGSTLISLYLIWFPIKLFSDELVEEVKETFTSKNNQTGSSSTRRKGPTMAERIDGLFD